MKKLQILICCLVLCAGGSNTVLAQKCKFDVDKKDDFSGDHVRNVRIRLGTFFYSWWMLLEQKGQHYYITVQSAATGKVDDIIPKGSTIYFKLESGKVLEMNTTEECVPAHNVQSNTIVSTWLPKGEVNKDFMKQLSESPLDKIRMKVGGKDFDSPDASGKSGRKCMESAQCMIAD